MSANHSFVEGKLSDPAVRYAEVDPAVNEKLPAMSKAVWVGTQGTLWVKANEEDEWVAFHNAVGVMPIRVGYIQSTSTADQITVLY